MFHVKRALSPFCFVSERGATAVRAACECIHGHLTDPNAWSSAATNTSEITFTGIAPAGSFTNEGTATGLTIDGVTFTGQLTSTINAMNVLDERYAAPWFDWGQPATLESPVYNLNPNPSFIPYIHVVLPANTTAFSALLGSVSPNSLSYQVSLSDGEVFTIGTNALPNLTFFGVTTDTDNPITYANFTLLNVPTLSGTSMAS